MGRRAPASRRKNDLTARYSLRRRGFWRQRRNARLRLRLERRKFRRRANLVIMDELHPEPRRPIIQDLAVGIELVIVLQLALGPVNSPVAHLRDALEKIQNFGNIRRPGDEIPITADTEYGFHSSFFLLFGWLFCTFKIRMLPRFSSSRGRQEIPQLPTGRQNSQIVAHRAAADTALRGFSNLISPAPESSYQRHFRCFYCALWSFVVLLCYVVPQNPYSCQ
jgi:hypothetical protein